MNATIELRLLPIRGVMRKVGCSRPQVDPVVDGSHVLREIKVPMGVRLSERFQPIPARQGIVFATYATLRDVARQGSLSRSS